MTWPHRLLFTLAILIAASLPLLSARLALVVARPDLTTDRAGLTLGEKRGPRVVVTSLRIGGPADRGGVAVGDEVNGIAGQPVTSAAMARRLIDDPVNCAVTVDLRRGDKSHVASISQCNKNGG